jgi:hypothetical protein
VVLLIGLASRLLLACITPIFFAPDEEPHVKYVQYLAQHASLPVQQSETNAPTNDWEYYQPPIYYALTAPIYWLVDQVSNGNVYLIVRALRLFSIALWCLNAWIALLILRKLRVTDPFLLIFVIGLVSLLPTYVFLSASVNNDNLLITVSGVLVLMLVRGLDSTRTSLAFGALVGISLLIKLTGIVFLVAALAYLLIQLLKHLLSMRVAILRGLLVTLPTVALFAPWGIRNLILYGDITGESVANVPAQWSSLLDALVRTYLLAGDTFWSAYGSDYQIRFLPIIGIIVAYLSIFGYLFLLVYKRKYLKETFLHTNNSSLLVMFLALLIQTLLVFRFGLLYGQGQGRFFYPLLIPLALLIAIGLAALSERIAGTQRLKDVLFIHVAGFLVTYLAGYVAYDIGQLMHI